MNPLIENIVISVMTGVVAAATQLSQAATERDWVMIGSTFAIAFGGTLINGLRQLQKQPVTEDPTK